tara:strand:+ start:641 stop:1327 length:687 start_codon:yes stop_codon:yes gene_type:complete
MQNFILNRKIAQLAVLQRIELCEPSLKKMRKFLGRYLFSSFLSKYLINPVKISKSYFDLMEKEFLLIKKYLKNNDKILSIGSGIGGLEILINKNLNSHITFIEKNYISKKIKYGWDKNNQEAYNNLNLLKKFLLDNDIKKDKFAIFDFDKNKLPDTKFDLIVSLYSLDYHYEFELYKHYLNKVMKPETIIIFDTIRPDYFKQIYEKVEIIKQDFHTVHKSKRVVCSNL